MSRFYIHLLAESFELMLNKFLILLTLFSIFKVDSSAQNTGAKHTYGLVVGISEYKDPALGGLNFADDDALLFASFLKSSLVRAADTGNIVLLRNKTANSRAVSDAIIKIEKSVRYGDTVYYYFAGHGDAFTPEIIFFNCYDAQKGRNDEIGNINIRTLKSRIKKLSLDSNIYFILITDACRSNELNNLRSRMMYTEAFKDLTGEIRFTSCSSNQSSFEDRRWDNGHGVFTYYLVKGWMGLADRNEDNVVSFDELQNYVKIKVSDDVSEARQTPDFSCQYGTNTTLNRISKEKRNELFNKEANKENLFAALKTTFVPRGSSTEGIVDSIANMYYKLFNNAIDRKELLPPEGSFIQDTSSALHFYTLFRERQKTGAIIENARMELSAAMANEAQACISGYLEGRSDISRNEFRSAYRLMAQSLEMTDSTHIFYTNLKARTLFLEANASPYSQYELDKVFNKLDSSLKLEPNKAYVYYNKARIYGEYNVFFDKAESNYLKAIELSPKWLNPMIDLAYLYIDNGKYEKGTEYMNKAIAIEPGPYIYYLLGYTYQHLSDSLAYTDSAIAYYNKSLEIDSNYVNSILGLAMAYQKIKETDKAVECYKKALELDPYYYYTHYCYGNLFYDANQMETAVEYYKSAIDYYPQYFSAHWMLAKIYNYKLIDKVKATEEYEECVRINSYHTKSYVEIGLILNEYGLYDLGIEYLKYPLTYDANYDPVYLGQIFLERAKRDSMESDYDSARYWLDSSLRMNPDNYYAYSTYGSYYWNKGQRDASIASFRRSIAKDETYYYNWLMLGYIFSLDTLSDSVDYYYNTGIKKSSYDEEFYKYLWNYYRFNLNNPVKASSFADSAILNNVNKPYFFYLKTYSLYAAGEFEKALSAADSAIALHENPSAYIFSRAMVLCSLQRPDEALQAVKDAIKAGLQANKEDFYDGRFTCLHENKKYNKLVKKYLRKQSK